MNPYKVLGVRKTASPGAIKAAFRELAKAAHPDHGGDRQEFERIHMAYDVLMDPERRAHYDATGEIREQKADNRQAAAITALSQALVAVLGELSQSHKEPNKSDLVALMRRRLTFDIDKREKDRLEIVAVREPLADLRDRFTVKDGAANLMESIIAGMIKGNDQRISQLDQADAAAQMALEILDDQEFDFDAPVASVQIFMAGAFSNSTATST